MAVEPFIRLFVILILFSSEEHQSTNQDLDADFIIIIIIVSDCTCYSGL